MSSDECSVHVAFPRPEISASVVVKLKEGSTPNHKPSGDTKLTKVDGPSLNRFSASIELCFSSARLLVISFVTLTPPFLPKLQRPMLMTISRVGSFALGALRRANDLPVWRTLPASLPSTSACTLGRSPLSTSTRQCARRAQSANMDQRVRKATISAS